MEDCAGGADNPGLSADHFPVAFMKQSEDCQLGAEGIRQAELFRACGLDWGEQPAATSTQQNFWLVGLLRTLEGEGLVERDTTTKKWKLK